MMAAAVALRTDFSAAALRRLAAATRHAAQSRRLLSLAAVLDGMSRGDAARIGGMDRQTLRDWVHRFNAHGPEGLKDRWSKGNPPRLSVEQQAAFVRLVEVGPDQAVDGVVRWRRIDLQRVVAPSTGSGQARALRHPLPRAHHRQAAQGVWLRPPQSPPRPPRAGSAHDRGVPANWPAALKAHTAHIARSRTIEVWFQSLPRAQRRDEMRLGQKNGLVRQWARKGSRPRQPADQRYENAYLFGAVCPARGVGAALVMPYADTEAMQLHLDEISRTVRRRAHAVLLLDRAGWHTTSDLVVPGNIKPGVASPPRSPELNPPEPAEGREHLAVPARKLAVEPHLRHLRGDRRRRLRGLEQAHQTA